MFILSLSTYQTGEPFVLSCSSVLILEPLIPDHKNITDTWYSESNSKFCRQIPTLHLWASGLLDAVKDEWRE